MVPAAHFRALSRRPVALPATLAAGDDTWSQEVSVTDLGLGGAGILARQKLPAQARLRLQLTSPNLWDPLVILVVVRWTRGPDEHGVFRVGVGFELTSGHQVRAVADLIASTAYE